MEPKSEELQAKDLLLITTAVQPFAEKWAEVEKTRAETQVRLSIDQTQRAELIARSLRFALGGVFLLYLCIAILAGIALWRGDKELTEKFVIGLLSSIVSLLGGMGIARSQRQQ